MHGIPDSRPLQNGDIVSVDVSVFVGSDGNGFHGDCCGTYTVGHIDNSAKHLVRYFAYAFFCILIVPCALFLDNCCRTMFI